MTTEIARDLNMDLQRRDRVIIAAAVAAVFGRPMAIRRITASPAVAETTWTREGRMEIHQSHRMSEPLSRAVGGRSKA